MTAPHPDAAPEAVEARRRELLDTLYLPPGCYDPPALAAVLEVAAAQAYRDVLADWRRANPEPCPF